MFKSMLKYGGIFCLSYLGIYFLLGAVPVKNAQAGFFRKSTEAYLQAVLPKAYIAVQSGTRQVKANDLPIAVHFTSQRAVDEAVAKAMQSSGSSVQVTFPTKEFTILFDEFFLIPFVFLLALLMATPIGWRKKGRAVAVAVPLFLLFVFLKMHIYALDYISTSQVGVYEMGNGWTGRLIGGLHFNLKIGASMMAATLIWGVATFKYLDVKKRFSFLPEATKEIGHQPS